LPLLIIQVSILPAMGALRSLERGVGVEPTIFLFAETNLFLSGSTFAERGFTICPHPHQRYTAKWSSRSTQAL